MNASPTVRDQLLAAIPSLRAFAATLSNRPDRVDDLVQETLVKAWANLHRFTEGTSMRAWLFTILRNAFYSDFRKRRREVEDADGAMAARLATLPGQVSHMDLQDFRSALGRLPPDQREALILVGASGFSYEEAAEICGCAIGTVKSRLNRARHGLARLLALKSKDKADADAMAQVGILGGPRTR